MVESDTYLLQLKFKEQIITQKQLQLNKSMTNYTVSISTNETYIVNGGVLTVNLYKLSKGCIDYFAANGTKSATPTTEMIMNWL